MPDGSTSKTALRPTFRPDVQGLRAVAVVTVIAAHAGWGRVSGGYVGVDVFFTISGFLITSLLLREVTRTGRLRLVDFYARRARRLLPAAGLVLVATVLASLVLLPLIRAPEIMRDSVWASLFGANFRFAAVGTDYFAQGEPLSPLQHFWSLSVEEQFYLVWPVLIVGWLALARRRDRVPTRRSLAVLLGVLTLGSLVYSVVATHVSPTAAYFSTAARVYELGLGALAALLLTSSRFAGSPMFTSSRLRGLAAVVGMGAILGSVLVFTPATPFPGYLALVPTLGAALLLVAGHGEAPGQGSLVSRALSLGPVRAIGDWSYSLYLWHWPILRIAQDRAGGDLSWERTALLLVVIVVVSAMSYRWVETPFREGRSWSRPRLSLILYPASVLTVLALAFAGGTYVDRELGVTGDNVAIASSDYSDQDLSRDRYVALVQASVFAAQEGRPVPSGLEPPLLGLRQDTAQLGECDYRTGTRELCPRGDTQAERSMVLLGDSHARAWAPAIERMGAEAGYAVYVLVYSGCSVTTAVQVDFSTQRPFEGCEAFKDWAADAISELHPEMLVVATSAVSPVMPDEQSDVVGMVQDLKQFKQIARDGFDQALSQLEPLTSRLVVLGNTPKLPAEPGVCLSERGVDLGDCLFERGQVARDIQLGFKQVAKEREDEFVDASKWFCFKGECPSVVGNTVTMRDSEHMTTVYSGMLAEPLAKVLDLPIGGA